MSHYRQDVAYSLRQVRRRPGVAAAAILCLSLGIGANSAVFSVADSLLFYDPPVREPDRLVRLFVRWASGLRFGSWSYPDFVDLGNSAAIFSDVIAETPAQIHLSSGGQNRQLWASIVSGNYFTALGAPLEKGRGFLPEEDRTRGTHPAAVVSHGLWQELFGGDPAILGRTLQINNHPFVIVGVAARGFQGTNVGFSPTLWLPILMQEKLQPGFRPLDERGSHWLSFVMARLQPGVSLQQAQAALEIRMEELARQHPDSNTGKSAEVFSEREAGLHPMVRPAFVGVTALVFGVVLLVLLLACTNVAGLLLAQTTARSNELAVRRSLGASRWDLLRQLLTESMILASLGGLLGILCGYGLIRVLAGFNPPSTLPMEWRIEMNALVLGLTLAVTVFTGLLCGLVPGWKMSGQDVVAGLKSGLGSLPGGSSRLRQGLVVFQITISIALLVVAGLALRSLQNVVRVDPGFDPDHLLVASIDLDLQGYDSARGRQFQETLKESLGSLPGVTEVGLGTLIPLQLMAEQIRVSPRGYQVPEGANLPSIDVNHVDEDYFQALGIPLLRGRSFRKSDDHRAPPVIVINEAFAERFFPGRNPVGEQVRLAGEDHRVIGVVPTGKYFSLGEDPRPFFYRSLDRVYRGSVHVHVKTSVDPSTLLEPVRERIRELDRTLPVVDLQPMRSALDFAIFPARLVAALVTAFAGLALFLAAVGLYGVVSFFVDRGAHDIAVRLALGSPRSRVVREVVGRGLKLAASGLAFGLLIGLALARLITSQLYGVDPADGGALVSASLVLAAVALLASYLPALRASRISPMQALRAE